MKFIRVEEFRSFEAAELGHRKAGKGYLIYNSGPNAYYMLYKKCIYRVFALNKKKFNRAALKRIARDIKIWRRVE
jgi:hypothetical protein